MNSFSVLGIMFWVVLWW